MKKIICFTLLFSLVAIPAKALTVPYPETIRVSSDITCPSLYPIKTGSSSGGVYTTTCYSQLAWDLNMAGGDDWTSWVNGTYVAPTPEPSPTPTITVQAAPILKTVTVREVILEPCPALTKPKEIRKEIRDLKKKLLIIKKERKIKREINRLQRQLNGKN